MSRMYDIDLAMRDRDEYHRHAEFCEEMARQAANQKLRNDWLRLAEDWRAMMGGRIDHDEVRGRFQPAWGFGHKTFH